jgi:hypothetical protein
LLGASCRCFVASWLHEAFCPRRFLTAEQASPNHGYGLLSISAYL